MKGTEFMDKRREEFTDFRTRLMELSNDAIITVDKNGFLEIFNPAALSLFGYSPEKSTRAVKEKFFLNHRTERPLINIWKNILMESLTAGFYIKILMLYILTGQFFL